MAQTVEKTETKTEVTETTTQDRRPREFTLSTEEIQADVRRAPRAYARALKVETDGE